ncbi:MAG: hypothetical protein FJ288_15040 [Planctomycetes bacterium]|nr:hypothetical protein [Planctomycetota bacterium]
MPGQFEASVKACAALSQHYQVGLQALRQADKERIQVNGRQLTGSVDVDSALAGTLPNAPRWDYGIGHRPRRNGAEAVHWVEVHPATDGEVKVIEAKLDWLANWAGAHAPALWAMKRRYVWVSSGNTHLTPTAPGLRRLAQRGVKNVGSRYTLV